MAEPTREELLELLVAVLEAVDLPVPAAYQDERYLRVLERRTDWVRSVLVAFLEADDRNPGWAADFLRQRLAENPTDTYTHYRAPEGSAS